MHRTTLSKVAREAGVSKTTASLVLNGKANIVNISKSTQSKVTEVAKRLNYKPAKFNPGRLNGQTGLLVVFSTEFHSYEKCTWLQAFINKGSENGCFILPQIANKNNWAEMLNQIPADAFIFIDKNSLPENLPALDFETPIICAGFIAPKSNITGICMDPVKEINDLIAQLYRHNKKAIGFLGEPVSSPEQRKILETYKENYCERFGITENTEFANNEKDIREACLTLIEKGANGIIVENSELTEKALKNDSVRHLNNKGVVFACLGITKASDYLKESFLLHSNRDIDSLAGKVFSEIYK